MYFLSLKSKYDLIIFACCYFHGKFVALVLYIAFVLVSSVFILVYDNFSVSGCVLYIGIMPDTITGQRKRVSDCFRTVVR